MARTTEKTAPSITDVARVADVSVGTVSRVMNDAQTVNPELKRRVDVAARRIGFSPRTIASQLAIITGRHSSALPVGYTDIMTSLVERLASHAGLAIALLEEAELDRVYDCRVSAAIGVVFSDQIQALTEIPNLPVITINHPMVSQGIHSVYVDHYEQGVLATKHLVERGHRKIALLEDLPDEWGAAERRRGVQDVLKDAGVTLDPALVRFSGSDPVYEILRRWTQRGVTAILNLSEDVVPEVLHILSNVLNLRIGSDISTITLEDLPVYQYFSPPQTVIRQPLAEVAERAVQTAIRLADRRNGHEVKIADICLHGELVERDSVATVAAD